MKEFEIANNLLYKITELKSKNLGRKEVKQLLIPKTLLSDVLTFIHDSTLSSHPGKEKSYELAQQVFLTLYAQKHLYTCVQLPKIC